MTQQSLRTALALYGSGTIDLETAAQKAGVAPAHLKRAACRLSVPIISEPEGSTRERLTVSSD